MNMKRQKRKYSPSVDEIREYNVKRSKLFNSFGSLSLQNNENSTGSSSSLQSDIDINDDEYPTANKKGNHIEVIDDIDEYLIQNQSDEEVIQNNKQFFFDLPQLQNKDNALLNERWTQSFNSKLYNDWSLVKYNDPWSLIYQHWKQWYNQNQRYFHYNNNSSSNYTHQPQFHTFNHQQYYDHSNTSTRSVPKIYELSSHNFDDEDLMLDDEQIIDNGIVEEPVTQYQPENHYPFHQNHINHNINKNIGFGTCRDGLNGGLFNRTTFAVDKLGEVYDDDDDCMDIDG